jgi:coenzyme F420-reducing hydrogenase gamma subunit
VWTDGAGPQYKAGEADTQLASAKIAKLENDVADVLSARDNAWMLTSLGICQVAGIQRRMQSRNGQT